MRKKIILLSLMLVTLIFSFHATWAYFKDSKEYKTAFSGQVAYNNGLSYSINGTTNNQLNVNFNDGKNTPVRTYQLTIKNNTSYQLNLETIKFETNPIMIQNYQIVLSRAKITENENEFVCDLSISLVNTQSTTENFTLPKVVAYSVGNKKIESTKDYQVTIIPQMQGIYNDVQQDLGDLGIPGYFHIFAEDIVRYNGGFNSYGNIATRELHYNGEFNSQNLINYVSNTISLNGHINNSAKFVVGNNITGITNVSFGKLELTKEGNSKYLDFDKELEQVKRVSQKIAEIADDPNKLSPIVMSNVYKNVYKIYIDTSSASDKTNICVYNIDYDYNIIKDSTIYVKNQSKKFVIINLNLDKNNYYDIVLPDIRISNDDCPYVLWNINRSDNEDISAKRNGFDSNYGTILMPNGLLTLNTAGTFNGNFIGKRFVSNGSTKRIEMKKLDLEQSMIKN